MARLLKSLEPLSSYKDRKFDGSLEQYIECLRQSRTVYVGNLAFHTTEEQLHELFGKCGDVRRIIMGLDKNQMTPCGFCFVEYFTRKGAEDCVKYLNGTILDDRPARIDFDWGFQDGRQFGRGKSGGQVRDEYRTDFDNGRGGYGKLVSQAVEQMRGGMDAGASPDGQQPGARKRGRDGEAELPSPPPGGPPPGKRPRDHSDQQ